MVSTCTPVKHTGYIQSRNLRRTTNYFPFATTISTHTIIFVVAQLSEPLFDKTKDKHRNIATHVTDWFITAHVTILIVLFQQ